MNKVILMGRLTKDPDIRWTQDQKCVARYTLAVDRRGTNAQGQREADFISCVAFGKSGEFADKYLHKGTKIVIEGRIQTGSYINRDGQKVYTTEVIIESSEFAESAQKGTQTGGNTQTATASANNAGAGFDSFMDIPEDVEADSLPFN